MAGRAMWNGTLAFGMIQLPVALVKGAQEGKPALSLACKDGHKLSTKRVCGTCGEDVAWLDVRHAYFSKGTKAEPLVSFTHEDNNLVKGKSDKLVKVEGVVPLAEVDLRYTKDTYYLIPQHKKESGYLGLDGYILLRDALNLHGMGMLCKLTIRSRERIVLVRTNGRYLVGHQLWYKDEVNVPDIEELAEQADEGKLGMAQAFFASAKVDFADYMSKQEDRDSTTLKQAINVGVQKLDKALLKEAEKLLAEPKKKKVKVVA